MDTIITTKSKWYICLAMSASLAIVYLDQTGVALTLESLQQTLGLSNTSIQWVMNAYLLAIAVFILLGGRLADSLGHRRIFLTGMSIFLVSSAFCGTAQSGWWLILSRGFQGLGGSMLIPTSIVLIANSTNQKERGKMIGISISIASFFLAFGPTIGGFLTQACSWRLIFWINIPIGLLSIILSILFIPQIKPKVKSTKIDWPGFASFAISLISLVTALMQAYDWGWHSAIIISLFVNFIVFFTLFILFSNRTNHPLVDLSLFKNRKFLGGNIILFLLQTCHVSSAVFWVLYLQKVLGYSTAKAGLYILPVTLPVIFCAQISGRLLDKYGEKVPIILGLLMATTGIVCVAIYANYLQYSLLFIGFLLYGIGAPLVIPAAMTSIISSVENKNHGLASGMANFMRQIGGTIGLSVIGVVIETVTMATLRDSQNLTLPNETSIINTNTELHSNHIQAYALGFSYGMAVASFFAVMALSMAIKTYIFKESKHTTEAVSL